MKYLGPLILLIGLTFFGCNHDYQSTESTEQQPESLKPTDLTQDKEEIQNLIRQVLKWSDSEKNFDILPVLTDSKDSVVIGVNLKQHNVNLGQLKDTDFFASEFIQNYNQIILKLDRKLRNQEFDDWLADEMPPFNFASSVNPWCSCQDVPHDSSNPLDHIYVEVINSSSEEGEFNWKWGNLTPNEHPDWKEFSYRFKVLRENGKWRISYLQGFDFEENTR